MYRYPELTTQSYMPSVATDLGLAWGDDAYFHNTYPDLTDGAGLARDDPVPSGSSNLPLDFTVYNAFPDINSMSSEAFNTWPRFERDIGTYGELQFDDNLPTLPPKETFDFRTDVRLRTRGPQSTDNHHNLFGSTTRVTPSRGESLMGQSIDGNYDAPISPVEYSEAGFTAHAWSSQPPHTAQPLGSDYSANLDQQFIFPSNLTLTPTPISANGGSSLSRVKQTRAAFLVAQRAPIEMTESRTSGSQESRSWNGRQLSQARIEQRRKQGIKARKILDQAFRGSEYTNGFGGPGRLFIKGRMIKLVEAFELAVTQPLAGRASSSFERSHDKTTKRHNFALGVMRLVGSLDKEEYMWKRKFSLKRIEELERKQQELGL